MFISSNKNQMLALDTQLCLAYVLSKTLRLPKFYKNFSKALFEKCCKDETYFFEKRDTYLFLFYEANTAISVYFNPESSLNLYDLGNFGKVSYFRKKFYTNTMKKLFITLLNITFENEQWANTIRKFSDSVEEYTRTIAELRFRYMELIGTSMKETKWMTKEHKMLREAILTA